MTSDEPTDVYLMETMSWRRLRPLLWCATSVLIASIGVQIIAVNTQQIVSRPTAAVCLAFFLTTAITGMFGYVGILCLFRIAYGTVDEQIIDSTGVCVRLGICRVKVPWISVRRVCCRRRLLTNQYEIFIQITCWRCFTIAGAVAIDRAMSRAECLSVVQSIHQSKAK